jgi:hypothetical protein
VGQNPQSDAERPRKKVQRLLRRPVQVDGGVIVSAERRRGRIVVRVESPHDER